MYNIPYFKTGDKGEILQFMQQHPFAMLIAGTDKYPVATQVPLLLHEKEGQLLLSGHIMHNTDHHKALLDNNAVLCVFSGPHAYVSASWYTDPGVASTWNYMSVHAKGNLTFTDEAGLVEILQKTTSHFENNAASPASFEHLPQGYVERLVKAIAGFTIEVTEVEHVFKLSQNRDKHSYENIIRALEEQDAAAQGIAAQMKARASQLFNTEQ